MATTMALHFQGLLLAILFNTHTTSSLETEDPQPTTVKLSKQAEMLPYQAGNYRDNFTRWV